MPFRTTPASSGAQPHHHVTLRGFRAVSRRTLAIGTVALSMLLVVVHDLPAAATIVPIVDREVEGQQLNLTEATVLSPLADPITQERDGYALISYTPVQYPLNPGTSVSAGFGHRSSPCPGCSTNHSGVDWTPGLGTPVEAIADGVVVSMPMSGWGVYVVIQHVIDGQTVYSGYAHLLRGSNLAIGTPVARGDVIGLVGNTGPTSGTHLHFSVIVGDRQFVDPQAWLAKHVTEAW